MCSYGRKSKASFPDLVFIEAYLISRHLKALCRSRGRLKREAGADGCGRKGEREGGVI